MCGCVLVVEVDGRAAEESANRRGECGLHVWIGMVCVVPMSERMDPSELGGIQWPLGRGGAALGERCQHRDGRQGRVPTVCTRT